MSLDMATILNESIGQGYLLANQMQVPNMYYQGESVWNSTIPTWYPYDPNASARLLDAAGYKAGSDGVRFTLKFLMSSTGRYSQTSNILKLTQLMETYLKAVGINMELDMMEHSSYEAQLFAAQPKSWNIAFAGVSESPDPSEVSYQVRSDIPGNVGQGGWNWGAYNNSEVNYLAHLGDTTPDVNKRVAIYQKLSGIIFDNVVLMPLYYPQEVVAWNKQYQGFILGLGNPPHDYWGALKYQSLAQVTFVPASTTSAQMTTTTAAAAPDYTMVSIIAVIAVIVVGAIGYIMGRRGKKAS
jgi:peptide/nickel transport system substrate-binding protein